MTYDSDTGYGGAGGGLYNENGALTVTSSPVHSNSAAYGGAGGNGGGGGGGGGIYSTGSTSTLTVTHSSVYSNSAAYNGAGGTGGIGGGIYNEDGTLTVNNSPVYSNSAVYGGDAGYGGAGGGIFNTTGVLTVNNSPVYSNSAAYGGTGGTGGAGGGITNYNGALTVQNSALSGNSATTDGGGLYNITGTVTLSLVQFISNLANNSGGGIFNTGAGTLTVQNSTLSGNSATTDGGGIANNSGTVTVTNSTLSENSAWHSGGGIFNAINGILNYANTIVANTSSGGDCVNDGGTIATNINNLIANGSCSAALRGDPVLGPLQDNGGNTWTHALLPSSPAIDAGDNATCATTDQRGQARADWQCDIGAYELQFADSATVTKAISGSGAYTFGPTRVKIEIAADGAGTLSSVTVTRTVGDHPGRTGTSNRGVGWGEYWTLTPNSGATSFVVSLTLPVLFTPDASAKVCRFISGTTWDCALTASSTAPFNTITRGGVTSFSDWAAGNCVDATAVTLSNLSASARSIDWVAPAALLTLLGLGLSAPRLVRRGRLKFR